MTTRIEKMCDEAIRIANDNRYGYDQLHRDGDNYSFDCSGLTYYCAKFAGYNVPTTGTHYTGTIRQHFAAISWRVDAFDGNVGDLEPGDLLLRDTHPDGHVAIYVGNGQMVEASCNELGTVTGGKQGDQTGREIWVCPVRAYASAGRPWTHVLTPPKDNAPAPAPINKNDEIIKLAKRIIELVS